MNNLAKANRIVFSGNTIRFKRYTGDFPFQIAGNIWEDVVFTSFSEPKLYAVQTSVKAIQRCLLMTTDPGDLVLDITGGSGTTAYVAENWGRRWITCDTSRVAITLAKQRLMTASFDYYELAHPNEGVGSGFKYKTVPHVTLKSIANNEPPGQETLYDQPFIDGKRSRVTGPFTVEAVPSPVARSFEEFESSPLSPPEGDRRNSPAGVVGTQGSGVEFTADTSVSRSGETLRQSNWRDELLRAGVRAKGGKLIEFTRVEAARGLRYVQAEAETKEDKPKKVYVVFGPEHAPLEQRLVELAWEEAKPYKPDILLFCALQFDEEAAKDIDEMNPEITKTLFLKAQMNADLLTEDLKKKRSSNKSFWLDPYESITEAELAAIIAGKPNPAALTEIDLKEIGEKCRLQSIIFRMASTIYHSEKKPGWKGSKEAFLIQLIGIIEQFIYSEKIKIRNPLFDEDEVRKRILIMLNMNKVIQHIWNEIRAENSTQLTPVFDKEHPIRSTVDVRTWWTSKPREDFKKSHISFTVVDNKWKFLEARTLNESNVVESFVKNDHLGFVILYNYQGVIRRYFPDFVIKLKNGEHLVLETKGQDSEQNKTKRAFLDEWCKAVNQHGGFGKWSWAVSFDPNDLEKLLRDA